MATLASRVWGNVAYEVSSDHNEEATWVSDYPEPCTLYEYTRDYGMTGCKHPGVDVRMPHGTPIYAIKAGVVQWIRNEGVPGALEVRIKDSQGHLHLYTHLNTDVVSTGQSISQGQLVGYSGTPSGSSAHLHFEHRIPDSSVAAGWRIIDPVPLLTGSGTTDSGTTSNTKFKVNDKAYNHTSSGNNVRSGPSTSYGIVGVLAAGADACVLDGPIASGGYTWYKITFGSVTGWCADANLSMRQAGGCEPSSPPPPEEETTPTSNKYAVNDKIYVSSGPLNVRSSPSTGATIYTTLAVGTDMCVVGGPTDAEGYRWWQIKYGSITGWVVERFTALRTAQGCASTTSTWTHKASPSNLNFRKTASVTGALIGVLYVGDRVQWLKNSSGSYITVSADGYTWCNVKSERHGVTGWAVNGFVPL